MHEGTERTESNENEKLRWARQAAKITTILKSLTKFLYFNKVTMTRDFEKHFKMKSGEIKT